MRFCMYMPSCVKVHIYIQCQWCMGLFVLEGFSVNERTEYSFIVSLNVYGIVRLYCIVWHWLFFCQDFALSVDDDIKFAQQYSMLYGQKRKCIHFACEMIMR